MPTFPRTVARYICQFVLVIAVLVGAGLGGLIELVQVKRGTGWLGVRDFTSAYLIGTVLIGLLEVLREMLLLRNGGRWTRTVNWSSAVTAIWIPVSAAILFNVLGNAVPRWLPAGYLGYWLAMALVGLLVHWTFAKRYIKAEFWDKKIPLDEYPVTPRRDAILGAVVSGAFAVASCVLLAW